jgi:hypothetical protein
LALFCGGSLHLLQKLESATVIQKRQRSRTFPDVSGINGNGEQ